MARLGRLATWRAAFSIRVVLAGSCGGFPAGPGRWRWLAPLLVWSLLLAAAPRPMQAQDQEAERPPGLLVLVEKPSLQGTLRIGVFNARPDPQLAGLWTVKLWQQVSDRVTVSSERINCSVSTPMRILRQGSSLELRSLNPGGAIVPANRLDHQIWWAVCQPSLAGRDPAGLAEDARRLGFSGQLPERLEIVPTGP